MLDWTELEKYVRRRSYRYVPKYDPAIDVDDLVQEVFLLIYKAEHNEGGSDLEEEYIARIIHNGCINALRKARYQRRKNIDTPVRTDMLSKHSIEETLEYDKHYEFPSETDDLTIEMRDTLRHLFSNLSDRQREVVAWTALGYTAKEIAESCKMATPTYYRHLQEARQKIRRHLLNTSVLSNR